MPAAKGHKKYGGRLKGTPNRGSAGLYDLFAKCEEKGLDVFEEMLRIALTTIDVNIRFNMLKEIAMYLYPKRKALEVDASVNMDLAKKAGEYEQLTNAEQIELMKAEIKRLEGE